MTHIQTKNTTIHTFIMTIEQQITQSVIAAVKHLYGQEVPEKMVQLQLHSQQPEPI